MPKTYTAAEMREAFIAGVEWPTAQMKYTAKDYQAEAERLYPDELRTYKVFVEKPAHCTFTGFIEVEAQSPEDAKARVHDMDSNDVEMHLDCEPESYHFTGETIISNVEAV